MDKALELDAFITAAAHRYYLVASKGEKRSEFYNSDESFKNLMLKIRELSEELNVSHDEVDQIFTTKLEELVASSF